MFSQIYAKITNTKLFVAFKLKLVTPGIAWGEGSLLKTDELLPSQSGPALPITEVQGAPRAFTTGFGGSPGVTRSRRARGWTAKKRGPLKFKKAALVCLCWTESH